MQQEKKNIATGIAGTIIFHLLLLIVFLTVKIGDVKSKHEEIISLELNIEEYKTIEEIIEENKPDVENIPQLDNRTLTNIVSNTAEKLTEEISTEKYVEEVMKELGMEEINPKHDNSLPDDPELANPSKDKDKLKKETGQNFGQTRITYALEDKRKAKYIDRPIYLCQGGGTVVIKISVDQSGNVIDAKVESSSTTEQCVAETALTSAKNFIFHSNYNSSKKVEGKITYIFVAQ
jgi:TonB family protein